MKEFSFHFVEQVDSTQRYAKACIESQTMHAPFLIYTNNQTHGIGTHGRSWEAKQNTAFLCSFVLSTTCSSVELSKSVACAVHQCIIEYISPSHPVAKDIRIKYPNDIVYQRSKLGGILIESYDSYVIIGIGINICDAPLEHTISLHHLITLTSFDDIQYALLQNIAVSLSRIDSDIFKNTLSNYYLQHLTPYSYHTEDGKSFHIHHVSDDGIPYDYEGKSVLEKLHDAQFYEF